ncbi:hypothetical protein [Dactylosporangium sp. NPDC051541]|uniref:hypothetical protein n=1 Tax=Dactylosporangium sp. NPDC051541 TaxID=3363977 RepID=UPI0037A8731A
MDKQEWREGHVFTWLTSVIGSLTGSYLAFATAVLGALFVGWVIVSERRTRHLVHLILALRGPRGSGRTGRAGRRGDR